MIRLRAGSSTDVGQVREINEDRLLTADRLFAVADGVGGHQAGEVASEAAVDALLEAFTDRTVDGLVAAVQEANRTVWQLAQDSRERRGMGTTLTALGVVGSDDEPQLVVVNVGDSRAYLLRQNELTQLTDDHSLVEEMVREGRLTPEEALVHPQRSIITRALGLDPDVEVDNWELAPAAGDRILLCSDGLTNEVSDDRIASVLRRLADPDDAARELVRLAKANGGNDNITVVVVDVDDDEDRAAEASAALADAEPAPPSATVVEPEEERAGTEVRPQAPTGPAEPVAPPAAAVRPRRFTWRVAAFLLLLIVVIAGAMTAVAWYARGHYYVGLDKDHVTIFKGRPGGLLWFEPTIDQRFELTSQQVPADRLPQLRSGHEEPTRADAQSYVNNLRDEAARLVAASTTTTAPPPTTTTAPPPTTTTAPPPRP